MGIIRKTSNTESLLSAERKVCKRILKAAPELPEEIPAFALRYKGFKSGRVCGNLGGTTEMSSSQRHFNDRDGGFFYFPEKVPPAKSLLN